MRINLFLLFFFLFQFSAYNQTISVVEVDRLGGGFNKVIDINPLNSLFAFNNYSDFSDFDQHYLFVSDTIGGNFLNPRVWIVDVNDTTNINSFKLNNGVSSISTTLVSSFLFNDSTGVLYSIIRDSINNNYSLNTINTSNGRYSQIDTLPSYISLSSTTSFSLIHIDSNWLVINNSFNKKLYTFDLSNAALVSNSTFPITNDTNNTITNLCYHKSGAIYGVFYNDSTSLFQLAEVNPFNGTHTLIGSPFVNVSSVLPSFFHRYTIDSKNNLFLFQGQDTNGIYRLFSANLSNGNIVGNPQFSLTFNQDSIMNPFYLHCDNNTGKYYGHTFAMNQLSTDLVDIDDSVNEISVYPNPTSNEINIELPSLMNELDVEIYSQNGRLVRSFSEVNTNRLLIERFDIPSGVYFLRITNGKEQWINKIIYQ